MERNNVISPLKNKFVIMKKKHISTFCTLFVFSGTLQKHWMGKVLSFPSSLLTNFK